MAQSLHWVCSGGSLLQGVISCHFLVGPYNRDENKTQLATLTTFKILKARKESAYGKDQ